MSGTKHPSTSPPLLPPQEADLLDRLRLLRSRRVGIVTYRRLLAEHGTAAEALHALPEVAAKAGVKGYQAFTEGAARAEIKAGERAGAQLISDNSPSYPAALAELDDAPPLLWLMGNQSLLGRPIIAIVGARNASSLGTRMTTRLAKDLGAAGFVVVSGLARGIDAAAHIAALDTGTIAAQAGGIDTIYPLENTGLAESIQKSGLRISEMPVGLQPQARHFPMRNRIISGLAQAVVVVEAAAKSGSLITARTALDQNREVLAVPGHPFDARASGCNMLIRDGAVLVRSAQDVIDAIAHIDDSACDGLPLDRPAQTKLVDATQLHEMILSRIGPSPMAEDQLLRDLATSGASIAPAIVDLELAGKITRHAGGLLARAE